MKTRAVSMSVRKLEDLLRAVSNAESPLILIYSNPDPDALASAWALKEIFHTGGISSRIGYTGEMGRLENATMMEVLGIPARPVDEQAAAEADCIALVDAQPDFYQDFVLPRCDIVFDHHPVREQHAYAFSDIRPACLATSSILTEYAAAAGVRITRKLATALFLGIQTDSMHQRGKPTGTDTFARSFLEPKVMRDIIRQIEFSSYSLGLLDYFSIALIRLRFAHNIAFTHIGPVPHMDICAQVADVLIRVKEAKWSLVSGVAGDKLVVVFRSDGYKKHAGKVAQAAFGQIGSAGGHKDMARAEIPAGRLPADVRLTSNERTEKFVLQCLIRADQSFRALLKAVPE